MDKDEMYWELLEEQHEHDVVMTESRKDGSDGKVHEGSPDLPRTGGVLCEVWRILHRTEGNLSSRSALSVSEDLREQSGCERQGAHSGRHSRTQSQKGSKK